MLILDSARMSMYKPPRSNQIGTRFFRSYNKMVRRNAPSVVKKSPNLTSSIHEGKPQEEEINAFHNRRHEIGLP